MEARDLAENWEQSYSTVLTYLDDIIQINNMFLYKLGLKVCCVILCKLCGNFSTGTNIKGFGSMEDEKQK